MSVFEHGTPGGALANGGAAKYGTGARRGAYWERVTGAALRRWLEGRPGDYHLFHDLGGFRNVSGHGYGPVSIGSTNIDHVILTGAGRVMINAKGCGAGTLGLGPDGHGRLTRPDGTTQPELWLDNTKDYSAAGVLVRLTGLTGLTAWIIPDAAALSPDVARARCLSHGGMIVNIADVGELAREWPHLLRNARPADPAHVATLARYLREPPPEPGTAPAAE